MGTFVSFVVPATVYAAILALIAMSFSLTYQAIGFVNFAHVQFVTTGAMVAVTLSEHGPIWLALVAAMAVTGLLAAALDLAIFRPMRRVVSGSRMIASAGVGVIIGAAIQYFWGLQPRFFAQSAKGPHVAGVVIRYEQIAIVVCVVVVLLVFRSLLSKTAAGRLVRATADSPELAESRGISSGRVVTGVWFASGALAALGGGLLGTDTVVSPAIGQNVLIPMFAAAVLGGLESIGGAVIGAILLSFGQSGLLLINFGSVFSAHSWFIPSAYAPALVFVLLAGVLLFRPQGILPQRRARV